MSDGAAPAAAPSAPGFSIRRLLGSGGMAAVWEASTDTGTYVALKVSHSSDPGAAQRLKREGDVMERVGPPYVPAFHGNGMLPDGRPYLAMERLVGRTLGDEIERWQGPPSLPVAGAIGKALLSSVAALHARGVLHRDLKPDNVFLVGDGAPIAKLMDFGLARAQAVSIEGTSTLAGAGTPEYMAPEQIAGREADLRSDVYALGVMLFELLTLRLPFHGDKRELEYAHLSFRPPRPSRFHSVPAAFDAIVLRCLAKEPARRFANAGALLAAFSEALAEESVEIEPVTMIDAMPAAAPAPSGTVAQAPVARAEERPAPLRGSERQKVALLFVQGESIVAMEVQAALEPFGGQVASTGIGKCVCAFTYRAGDNPGQRALSTAEALIAKGLAQRVILDVGTVAVKARPNGPPRLISALFNDAARYPNAQDPLGVLLTAAACALLPSVNCEPAESRPEHFVMAGPGGDTDRTQSRTFAQDAMAPLVGRQEMMRALVDDAKAAIAKARPRAASVLGEPGLGKTRLTFELTFELKRSVPGVEVIELRAREPLGNNADETLADLLRRTLDLPNVRPADGGREILTERLGEIAKEIYAGAALVLGWIPPDHPAVQALRAVPGVLRSSVVRAGMEALLRIMKKRPLMVLLDDAHWADDALLDALEQATVSELPFWVCALGRPSFAESRPTWGQRSAHAHVEKLTPLEPKQAAELCLHLLRPASAVPEPVIHRLVDRTEGVPLLVCDLVTGLRREGLVRKRAGGVWYVDTEVLDRLPDSPLLEWIVGRELDELPAELAAHARLAALLSPEFTVDEIDGVLAQMDTDLGDAFPLDARVGTERLKQSRVFVQHQTGRYGIRNALTREAVAKTVADPLALRIHKTALAYYRAAPLPDGTRLPRLAWHAAQAGEKREAASTYLLIAERSRERHNYLEADLLYTRAIAELEEPDNEGRLRAFKGRGIARYRLSRNDGSVADLAIATELAMKTGDKLMQADVMLDESMALDWLREWHRSRELSEKARDLVGRDTSRLMQARLLLALGRSHNRFNQDQEAAEVLREADRIAESIGDDAYEVRVTANLLLGFLLPFIGHPDEAEQRLATTLALCEQKSDELHQTAVWNNRSCLWIALNQRDHFLEDSRRVLAYARRMGNFGFQRDTNFNSAYFFYWRGEFAEAEPYARQVFEIDQKYFWQGGFRPDAPVLLARILWGKGEREAALKLAQEIKHEQAVHRAEGKVDILLLPNDEMLLDMILLVLSNGGSEEWETLLGRARSVAVGQELIEVLEIAGITALERGERDAARKQFAEAIDVGGRIPNVMMDRLQRRIRELG